MDTLRDILDPNFLLRNSIYVSLLVGVVCPLVGMFLILRRQVFLGIAVPQISSCGIALAFALQAWGVIPHIHEDEHVLAFIGSTTFTLPTILLLALSLRGRGSPEGRLGTVYALAGAWGILLLVTNPLGEHGLLDMLKGEIIAVSGRDLTETAIVFTLVVLVLYAFRKEFLLVSFDPEMAVTLRKNVRFWDAVLFLVVGLTISIAVLSVGPLVAFGFLLIPALTAHRFARNMQQFALLSSALGVAGAFLGFLAAYQWDLPVGPTDVAVLGCFHLLALALDWLRQLRIR
jgi:ABC-type Mn2+/Zn2+ transport system permease subunit